MAKLKSTFPNMVISLTSIALVAAGALSGIYLLTKTNIELQKQKKQQEAISAVLPTHASVANAEEVNGLTVHKAYDAEGNFVGAAVETSENGFGGTVRLMVGFDAQSTIVGYEVLEQTETPGLGTHMTHWFKNADKPGQNIVGREATGKFQVSKDGGDVDAITAATISSRAFLDAVNKAYAAYANGEVEAASGATVQATATDTTATCECGKPIEECCKTKGTACEGDCGACEKHCNEGEGHCQKAAGCGACEHSCEHGCKH